MSKLNTLKRLGSLFRSSINSTTAAAAKTSPVADKILKHFVSSLDFSSASTPKRTFVKSHKRPQPSKPPSPVHLSNLVSIGVDTSSCSASEDPTSILSEGDNGGKPSEDSLKEDASEEHASKEDAWEEDASEEAAFEKEMYEELRAVSLENMKKRFNALLKICIEKAITTDDEFDALEQVFKAYDTFIEMKDLGCPIEEESYGEVLLYLIDRGMVEQFHRFTNVIRDVSGSTLARLDYYEMLLYTRFNDLNALLKIFIEKAITTDDETDALEQVSKAVKVFIAMKEQGFPINMVEQFHHFSNVVRDCQCTFTSDGQKAISLRTLFPGLWLGAVIADAYMVPEILETGKR